MKCFLDHRIKEEPALVRWEVEKDYEEMAVQALKICFLLKIIFQSLQKGIGMNGKVLLYYNLFFIYLFHVIF